MAHDINQKHLELLAERKLLEKQVPSLLAIEKRTRFAHEEARNCLLWSQERLKTLDTELSDFEP